MSNIKIASEALKIIKKKEYEMDGKVIRLPEEAFDEVIVIDPSEGKELAATDLKPSDRPMCKITVENKDSFQAAAAMDYENVLVMNFANPFNPGGGFRRGGNAQEESLCRRSTLSASLTSKKATEMYWYNHTHPSRVESDYMLISPKVCIFRDEQNEFLEKPAMVGVVTTSAPNKLGTAILAGDRLVRETMIRRIKIMLHCAIREGYKNLVLGAWGCGYNGNKPQNVSEYFRKVLIDEGYGRYFDQVCFAINGKEDNKNITAFRKTFEKEISD